MVVVKEKYFKTKYRPVGVLLNVNVKIHLRLQLKLKFRSENYSSIIVNFHTGLR